MVGTSHIIFYFLSCKHWLAVSASGPEVDCAGLRYGHHATRLVGPTRFGGTDKSVCSFFSTDPRCRAMLLSRSPRGQTNVLSPDMCRTKQCARKGHPYRRAVPSSTSRVQRFESPESTPGFSQAVVRCAAS